MVYTEAMADAQMMSALTALLIFFAVVFFGYWLISKLADGSKSNQYKKLLTDLYVAGRVRQLAKEDKIDLHQEMKYLQLYEKMDRKRFKYLDEVIEDELKSRIDKDDEGFLDLTGSKEK